VSFVVDNSVALTWCFEDERTPATAALLGQVGKLGALAPMLWPLEALNGLLVAERRGRLGGAPQRRRLMGFLRALPIMLDAETAPQTWTATARLAERFGLPAYDAADLEFAQRHQLPLASLDRDLRSAAAAIGVAVLGN
jgi:predicted nucleic acid-binding protein